MLKIENIEKEYFKPKYDSIFKGVAEAHKHLLEQDYKNFNKLYVYLVLNIFNPDKIEANRFRMNFYILFKNVFRDIDFERIEVFEDLQAFLTNHFLDDGGLEIWYETYISSFPESMKDVYQKAINIQNKVLKHPDVKRNECYAMVPEDFGGTMEKVLMYWGKGKIISPLEVKKILEDRMNEPVPDWERGRSAKSL